jgi:N-acetylmuramoyl-L-alanine amidase
MRCATTLVLCLLSALLAVAPAQAGRGAGHKTRVVAIDPGHGGKDQGAVGPGQILEKDVTLQIARRLQRLVNSEPGMRAVLTRTGDEFLHLYERIAIARRYKADLFISIHADAVTNPEISGCSVFVLSTQGASSAAAHWLAKHENEVDALGGDSLDVKDEALRAVVFDIHHDAILAESMALAEHVLGQLSSVEDMHTGMVERAGFAVLKAPDIPSILVETAFISNPREAAKLRSARYQQQLAAAILRGIRAYVKPRTPQYLLVQAAPARAVAKSAFIPAARPRSQTEFRKASAATVKLASQTKPRSAPGAAVKPASGPRSPVTANSTVKSISQPLSKSRLEQVSQRVLPRGSKVATRVHVIKAGETLANIAQRYRVQLSTLRSINGLSHNQSRMPAGTSLNIPVSGDS